MKPWLALSTLMARGRDADFIVCRGTIGDSQQDIRWSAFAAQVAGWAAAVASRPEQRWLPQLSDPLSFICSLLGIWQAGRCAVIPPNTQPATLDAMAAVFEARCEQPIAEAAWCAQEVAPDRHVLELYTSGSTGAPKAIPKALHQLDAELSALEAVWGAALSSAAVVSTVPVHHLYGLIFRVLWPLSAGRCFDLDTCMHPADLTSRLAGMGPSFLISSPAHLSRWQQLIPLTVLGPDLRGVFSSGGPLSASASHAWREALGLTPIEIFGSTETGGIAWRCQEGQTDEAWWTPLPDVHVNTGADGALHVRSPFLPSDQAWLTQDAGEQGPEGRFRLLGRLDRLVKIEEKRLALADMEAWLCSHPAVAEAAVVQLVGDRQRLGAALVLHPQALTARSELVKTLRAHVEQRFERVLCPKRWRFVAALPWSERGKLAQAQLQALFASAAEAPTHDLSLEHQEGKRAA